MGRRRSAVFIDGEAVKSDCGGRSNVPRAEKRARKAKRRPTATKPRDGASWALRNASKAIVAQLRRCFSQENFLGTHGLFVSGLTA